MSGFSRRRFLALSAVAGAPLRPVHAGDRSRVVIIGGGFAGATCAKYLRLLAPGVEVSLLDPQRQHRGCPFSNTVIAGARTLAELTVDRAALARTHGVRVLPLAARRIDFERKVVLAVGQQLPYDRLIVAPGIRLRWGSPEGYDRLAAEVMPHAWRAGTQTTRLAAQIAALRDGGVFAITVPRAPFRCPPGPYERASLIADRLARSGRRRAKILILDANETFSKQALFEEGWAQLYPGMIEHVPLGQDGEVVRVEPATMRLYTEFGEHRVDGANIIPAQAAGLVAERAGLTDTSGWCPVDPHTFESTLVPGVHVIGDAALASPMPKAASAANSQAKQCALAVSALLVGATPPAPSLHNTCYSLLASDYGISVNGIYRVDGGAIVPIEGAGGVSPLGAVAAVRKAEADYAWGWYKSIVADSFL